MNPMIDQVITEPAQFAKVIHEFLHGHIDRRLGHLSARIDGAGKTVVEALLLDLLLSSVKIVSTQLAEGEFEFPSVTRFVPAAHWAERALGDFFGLRAIGSPRWKSLILHDDAWPTDFSPLAVNPGLPHDPYKFLRVEGEGIHEIPVGPIHAGIIEPGHFRFSCAGEVITYLEIRLGYQHRGVEHRLAELPWQKQRFLAESATSDTPVANALAHALAIEQLLDIAVSPRTQALRSISLELERLANHVGDLGALSGDIGYSPGASLFGPLRASVLNLGMKLAGSRFQRYYIRPGGVSRDVESSVMLEALKPVDKRIRELIPLVLDNAAVIERMEGTGRVSTVDCRDFGLVGPAARASGIAYDVRHAFGTSEAPRMAVREQGDALARTQVRADEALASLDLVRQLLESLPSGSIRVPCDSLSLPPDKVGVGIVEAWRGELIHWITTDSSGTVSRYAIKDPSLYNWTGLAIAVRGNLVADFPLCNKSFNLSYSGNDL
jgi:Ni,Fe-hydrogenase III large subunit/Ni,Fe-hydrogenase III component G